VPLMADLQIGVHCRPQSHFNEIDLLPNIVDCAAGKMRFSVCI